VLALLVVWCPRAHSNSVATETSYGWTSWKVMRNWVCHVSSPTQNAVVVVDAQRNTFPSAMKFKAATNNPEQKHTDVSRLK
jgi:hypothetical protein